MKLLTFSDLSALIGVVAIALGGFHWLAKSDAKDVIKDEYSKLTQAITNLNQTVMKLGLQLDQALKIQAEQAKLIKLQDKRLDEHDVRLTRLEEHDKEVK